MVGGRIEGPGYAYDFSLKSVPGGTNVAEAKQILKPGATVLLNRSGIHGGGGCSDGSYHYMYEFSGSQTVRVDKLDTSISLSADRTEILRGDTVTFTTTALQGQSANNYYFRSGDTLATPAGFGGTYVGACYNKTSCRYVPPVGGRMYVTASVPAGSDTAESQIVRIVPPGLSLTCPNSVVRGSTLTCTASPKPAHAKIDSVQWMFTDAAANVISAPAGTSASWGGTMVIGGTMRVSANVAGIKKDSSAAISVTARPWTPLQLQVSVIGQDNLAYPPKTVSELANTDIAPPQKYPATKITAGPNTGWWYLSSPLGAVSVIHRWSNAWQASDPWYQSQTGGPHPSGNGNYCGPADLPVIEQRAREHEGMSAGAMPSHLSVLRDFFANFPATTAADSTTPQAQLEKVRVFGTATADSALSAVFESAVRTRALMDPRQGHYDPQTSSPGNPGVVPLVLLPCHLKW